MALSLQRLTWRKGEGQKSDHLDRTVSYPSNTSCLSFAPQKRPLKIKFRSRIQPQVWLESPRRRIISLLHRIYSQTLDSQLSRADDERFLERFRYVIVASQLLNLQTYPSHIGNVRSNDKQGEITPQNQSLTPIGITLTALFAFALAWLINWARNGANSIVVIGRIAVLLSFMGGIGVISCAYFRRQWLQHLRHETLAELSNLIIVAHNIDVTTASTLSFIQEVELVSRGYQIGSPLPPVSRIEDRNQIRTCVRLRKLFRDYFTELKEKYIQSCKSLEPLAERLDLEKYYDIYDVSNVDLSAALFEQTEAENEEGESIRALKILATRFIMVRKLFLCCLMALNFNGNKNDLQQWNITMQEIQQIRLATANASELLSKFLEENYPISPTTKTIHNPGRESRRVQPRQLNSLSLGIRGLQAKLHVLREDSERYINEAEDASSITSNLLTQYDSLGIDLKRLVQEWEDGRSIFASNLDYNERRKSCLSGILSPTTSLGGLTVVEESGCALDALKALNGEVQSRSSIDSGCSEFEEIFEAIAISQNKTLSKEERLAKMKDDRAKRYSARCLQDNNTKIIRELESVIRMRPKNKISVSPRISSI